MKKRVFNICTILLATTLLAGCKIGGKEIVFELGSDNDYVFSVGESKCSQKQARLFLCNYQNLYGNAYGVNLWDYDFEGDSLEEYVKSITLDELTKIVCMDIVSQEQEIALTEKEHKQVKKAAEEYYKSLNDDELSYMKVSQSDVVEIYENYALAEKLYKNLTEGVNTEVSDDEARSITVQQIYIPKTNTDAKTKATEAHEKVMAEDADFEAIALTYNEDGETEAVYRKGSAEVALENVVFSLDINQISEVVEGESGYYIIKCISSFNREETDANKAEIINQRKTEAFDAVYQEFIQQQPSQFNDELWKKLELKSDGTVSTSNFFGIYNQFMDIE